MNLLCYVLPLFSVHKGSDSGIHDGTGEVIAMCCRYNFNGDTY